MNSAKSNMGENGGQLNKKHAININISASGRHGYQYTYRSIMSAKIMAASAAAKHQQKAA